MVSRQEQPFQQLRLALKAEEAANIAAYEASSGKRRGLDSSAKLLAARSRSVDKALRGLWRAMAMPTRLALVAVGGYGRGELYPYSDVDLLVLMPDGVCYSPSFTAENEKIEKLVGLFWDIGLEAGHSVRSIEECLERAGEDISVQTNLLEARLLAGSRELFNEFKQRFADALDLQKFFQAKRLEQEDRYRRFNDSAFDLEPNCKESPGGLRDIHMVQWLGQAVRLGECQIGLLRGGFLSNQELHSLRRAEKRLQNLRIGLHLMAGRREDRLLFDMQTAVAERYGFSGTTARRPSEQLMQAYYRNARTVMQLNGVLILNMSEALFLSSQVTRKPLGDGFYASGQLLDIAEGDVFHTNPQSILTCFRLMQKHSLGGMTARALRSLWHVRHRINAEFRNDAANRQAFIQILQSGSGVLRALRIMNQYDILGRYLPAFGKIVGQMQHDLFHIYTVDQHSLMVVRNLRRFTLTEYAHEYPECTRLISAFVRPWLLYIAALFHDIAKGRGGDHSQLGMDDARAFCRQHEIARQDSELVIWLVGNHLLMSSVSQKQDISDQRVVADFALKVGDARRLIALYLLTVADIRATSPKVWNSWKGRLLADLYKLTLTHLSTQVNNGATQTPHDLIEERQGEALRLMRSQALPDNAHVDLWSQLDPVYFLRHASEEIAWHALVLHDRLHASEVISVRMQGEQDLMVMVYVDDQPDLFVRLTAFFARAGLGVANAKIHTTANCYALDSFVLINQNAAQATSSEQCSWLEIALSEELRSKSPINVPSANRLSRQVRHFPFQPEVEIVADESGKRYVMSVNAVDRAGLLYTVAEYLRRYQVQIHTARISTLGERVEDVFLLSGQRLAERKHRLRLESELLAALRV